MEFKKFVPVSENDTVTAIANALNSTKYMKEVYIKEGISYLSFLGINCSLSLLNSGFLESERYGLEEAQHPEQSEVAFFRQKMNPKQNEALTEEKEILTIKFSMVESPEMKELGKNLKKPANAVQQSPSG